MKKIITLLIMALLFVGSADAQKKTRKKTSRKARTTATTKAKTPTATPISEPQLVFDMTRLTQNGKKYYEKALAGDPEGQYCVGSYLFCGDNGFPQNRPEALRWYYLAAKQGYSNGNWENACFQIGEEYNNQYFFDNCVKENYFEAAKWYAKAAMKDDKQAQNAYDLLQSLLHGKLITQAQYNTAMREAGAVGSSKIQEMKNEMKNKESENKKYALFYGTWTSARGTTFTITSGPYLDLRGAGKFSGEWRSNGELHVSFGYPDEINLRYSNGYLYDRDGRMYWKIGN